MYLDEIIEPLITEKLKEMCVGKQVMFYDGDTGKEKIIKCKDVYFASDDGDCWIVFIDENDKEHLDFDQGIDIYFEIKDE
jgi:hypothetical protein